MRCNAAKNSALVHPSIVFLSQEARAQNYYTSREHSQGLPSGHNSIMRLFSLREPSLKLFVRIILTTPTPHICNKYPHNMPYNRGSVWHKRPLKSRDFYREYGIRTQKYGIRTPPFHAMWTALLGGAGGLYFAEFAVTVTAFNCSSVACHLVGGCEGQIPKCCPFRYLCSCNLHHMGKYSVMQPRIFAWPTFLGFCMYRFGAMTLHMLVSLGWFESSCKFPRSVFCCFATNFGPYPPAS